MNTLIVWTAQYLLWVMVAGFALLWLVGEDRRGKLDVAFQAVIGIAIMVVFLYLAKSLHHDPRPFVEDPSITPLFRHGADDGFPSDHSLAAGLIATLVLLRRRPLGLLFAAAAISIAWARVAAHVHHPQDVLAGLLLGALAAVLANVIVQRLVVPRLPRPGRGPQRAR